MKIVYLTILISLYCSLRSRYSVSETKDFIKRIERSRKTKARSLCLVLPQACSHQEIRMLYGLCRSNYHTEGSLTFLPATHTKKYFELIKSAREAKLKIMRNPSIYLSAIDKATSNRRMKTSYINLILCTRKNSNKFHIRNSVDLNNTNIHCLLTIYWMSFI